MANRLFAVIFLHTCLNHVVRPSSYVTFANSGGPKQINRLDIRNLYPGFHRTNGFTDPHSPNTESAPRHLDQVIPSQILYTDLPLSSTPVSILPNPSPSDYHTSSPWTKGTGFATGGFIRGIFHAADNGRRLTSPINIGTACGVSESGCSNFHELPGSNDPGRGFSRRSSGYRCSNGYDESARYCVSENKGESASSKTQSESIFSKPYSSLNSLKSISELVSCKSRSDSNLGGSCCNYGEITSSYSGLGSNAGRPYSNYDESININSELGCKVGDLVSSKSRSDDNLDTSYCSHDGSGNNLGELIPSKGRPSSNLGGPYCSYASKHYHDSTRNESTNESGRMGRYGGSGHAAMGVAGELPVVGRTTVAGRVPITGGVQFNGLIPATGRVTIGGSCYCGSPFVF